jgi:NADH-quinone oxidoreductase subunit L
MHHDSADALDDEDEHHHLPHDFKPHESPWTMTVPLVVLAFLSTVGGLVGIPYAVSSMFGSGDINVFERTLEPIIATVGVKHEHAVPAGHGEEGTAHVEHNPQEITTERSLAGLSVVLAGFGILIGWFVFSTDPLRKMPKILEQKWRIDELYNGYIVDPITNLSRNGLWKGFDLGFIDGIVNGIGHFVVEAGGLIRQIQVGFVRSYAAIILLGALVVIGYFIYYGMKLVG